MAAVNKTENKISEIEESNKANISEVEETPNKKNKKTGVEHTKHVALDPSLLKFSSESADFYSPLTFSQNLNAYNFLSIDIDTDKIRYIAGKTNGTQIAVSEEGSQIISKSEEDRNKALKLTLDNLKTNVYKSGSKVNVSFFNPDVTIRQFTLPLMRKVSELKSAIFYKLQSELPGFSEQHKWRYKIIETIQDGDTSSQRIVVVVVPGDIITKYIEMFASAGLVPETLIPRTVALHQAFNHMVSNPSSDILVDISYEVTNINFHSKENLEFTRNISSGASNLEIAVHGSNVNILGPDSFEIKEEEGIGKKGALKAGMIRKALKIRVASLQTQQNPVLQVFKNELQNSIDHFNKMGTKNKIDRIFLTGYGIQKESLLSFLKNNMKLPVFVLAPKLQDISSSDLKYGEYFSTLGAVVPANDEFNFVPSEFRKDRIFKRLNVLVSVLLGVSLLGMVYLTSLYNDSIENLDSKLSQATNKYEELHPTEVTYQGFKAEIVKLKARQRELLTRVNNKTTVVDVMRLVSRETPEHLVFTGFTLVNSATIKSTKRGKKRKSSKPTEGESEYYIQFSGFVNGDNLMSDIILINYVDHLKNLGYLKDINILNKVRNKRTKLVEFDIQAGL